MPFGLTSTGFERKTLDDLLTEIRDELRAELGPAFDTSDDSAPGQFIGVLADKLAELHEVAEAVYRSFYPNSADGASLDGVAALTGVTRLPATKSTVTITCTGDDGTIIPEGSVVSVDPGGARFVSLAAGTIAAGTVDIEFEAEDYGPVVANADTLTVIETPVTGWDAATNDNDAERGRNIETDEELRIRRVEILALAASSTFEAVVSEVAQVTGVEELFLFENDSDSTNADGMPPHSIEIVALGGADEDVAAAIYASKAAGIQAYGTTTEEVSDSQGNPHTIGFSRPVELVFKAGITVQVDPAIFPATGQTQIKQAVADFVNELRVGADVIRTRLYDPILDIAGVIDVTVLQIAFGADPLATANLTTTTRQLATADTSDITLTVTT